MGKNFLLYLIVAIGLIFAAGFVFAKIEKDTDKDGLSDREEQQIYNTDPLNADSDKDSYLDGVEVSFGFSPLKDNQAKLTKVNLDVPYINEAPDNNWTGPWKNACEEASMAMIEKYYFGKSTVAISEAKVFMSTMFTKQNTIWGTNADSDAKRTAQLINDYTVANAKIVDNPSVEDIKKELQQKHPVISLHYGFDLKNPNIPFVPASRGGTSYHMLVIKGYDDENKEFIVNDTGDRNEGDGYRYDYDLFMDSLHDYDFSTHKANGPARVIFTSAKLVKLTDNPKVFYVHDSIKQYIPNATIFLAKGWNWDAVNVVTKEWLDTFQLGEDIK
ncbi:MAG: C39 family peptidase [Candidatus Parcubacteria bacterium]|nr:C39 family peptidase [Candidatus Parcubacteria bacterium]